MAFSDSQPSRRRTIGLIAVLAILAATPVVAQERPGAPAGPSSATIPSTGGSDVSEDAIGGRGAAMEGQGVEGAKGAPGGAEDGANRCPPGQSVDARCRN